MLTIHSNANDKIWFISDLHLGHDKPFILNPRGYANINEAYDKTFDALKVIGPNDIVFNLGDAVVGAGINSIELARRLINIPCKTHYFVWGNHNSGLNRIYEEERNKQYFADDVEIYPITPIGTNFMFVGNYLEVNIDGIYVTLSHFPIASWNHISKGGYMIHGHCHRNLKDDLTLKRLDIGWDWKTRPIGWEEIKTELQNRKTISVDHH